jgi:two-component sensor histidine kinase
MEACFHLTPACNIFVRGAGQAVDSIDRLFELLVRRNRGVGLITALITVAIAVGIRVAFPYSGYPFSTFLPAILITAFAGGWLPASLAAAASVLYAWRFLIPETHTVPAAVIVATVVFATQIAGLEVIRVAARRAVARRKRADALLAERDVMFRELQHRVANNMQFISSLLALQSRQLPPGDVGREAMRDAANRLHRFATIHRRLHEAHRAERRFDTLAQDVLADLLQATGCEHVKLNIQAEATVLSLDALTTLILITTEAATNAVKHVFTQGRGSHLGVTLQTRADGAFELTITDDGPGFPEEPKRGVSLGFKIMQSLIDGLHGTMQTDSANGAMVRVVFPAPPGASPADRAAFVGPGNRTDTSVFGIRAMSPRSLEG